MVCVMTEKDLKEITVPLKAIRVKCLDCSCGNVNEVKLCGAKSCPLYYFRFGKNPYRKKVEYTEERKQKAREALAKYRNKADEFKGSDE